MLENEDIQHILLTRTPALTGRYEFLSFRNAAGGRAWLSAIREKAQSAAEAMASVEKDKRWVTVAFTWNGLRALGVDEGSLASFPEEFKQGMVARAEMLGDTGENHPDNWVGGLASADLHAIAILFARDAAERARCLTEHDKLVAQCEGVAALSALDLEATPPFDYAHDHFGYRDRLSQPVIEGTGEVPTPGTGAPLKPGEFILGYPDENGPPANLPQPEILSRNGSFMACHHCGHRQAVPNRCPKCASVALARHGAGTERLEHELAAALGEAEFPVLRLDADSAGLGARARTLSRFEAARSALLLGTQMVAKGHDFPDVALGIVLDADQTLRFPDFRAEERTFALITQLAGRAGRGDAVRCDQFAAARANVAGQCQP